MILYFAIFVTFGCIMGFLVRPSTAAILSLAFSVLWFFVFGPWAVATFVELFVGSMIGWKVRELVFGSDAEREARRMEDLRERFLFREDGFESRGEDGDDVTDEDDDDDGGAGAGGNRRLPPRR